MQNKLFILLLAICLVSAFANAQEIKLQKNGSFDKIKIHLPKNLSISYLKNNEETNFKGKVIKYEFPFIYFLTKAKDTLRIDVKNIVEIRIYNHFSVLKIAALTFITVMNFAAIHDIIKDNYVVGEIFISVGMDLGFYALVRMFPRSFETKTEWSFY